VKHSDDNYEESRDEIEKAFRLLREREERFRQLAQASFDAMYVSEDGIVVEANEHCVTMFGYDTLDSAVGCTAIDFVAPESRPAVLGRMASNTDGTFELVGVRKDGSKFQLEATSRTHFSDGKTVRTTVLRDLTERRHLEAQLRQAQKLEAIGQLTGAVAHDFNNLLMVITGVTEILLCDFRPGDQRHDDLLQVQNAADAATSLTRQLLAFSRKEVLEPRPTALEDVVALSTKLMKRLIGDDISVETTFSRPQSVVHIDPGQLEQVAMNLMLNARDAMPDGGRLSIATSVADLRLSGRYATLTVSDTGVGMDRVTRARIFEPFFTTKPPEKGTGLGLATVYSIVSKAGGFIEVESQPTQGSSFKVYLPLFLDQPQALEAEHSAALGPRGKETVLVVEDSDSVRDVARRALQRHGYEVLEARSAENALDIATMSGRQIDLLLTDVVMPDASGPELSKRFAHFHRNAKVLFMSGYSNQDVILNGILPHSAPLLQKPFTVLELTTRVREVLDRGR
jgi:PAS domain S-box-containing protein